VDGDTRDRRRSRRWCPRVAPPDAFYNAPYQQGVLVSWALDWAAMMSGRTMQVAGDGTYGGFGPTRATDFKLPYAKLNERRWRNRFALV